MSLIRNIAKFWCSGLMLLLLACGYGNLRAVIQDSNGLETEITRVRLVRGNTLCILDGQSERIIPFQKIGRIKITPDAIITHNGVIFYEVQIELLDGTSIMPYILPDGSKSAAYMAIENSILGQTAAGAFRLDFKNIKSIIFVKK